MEALTAVLEEYEPLFIDSLLQLHRQKLGLTTTEEGDQALIDDLLATLTASNVDYTIYFRKLCAFQEQGASDRLRDLFLDRAAFDSWAERYHQRLAREPEQISEAERRQAMLKTNPKYVLRNYMAEIAIRHAEDEGNYREIDRLLKLLQTPFDEHPDCEEYARHPPAWSQQLSVSCSS